ncbi:transcriptional regulator, IclR family [Rubrobacter xylanophilus DSM 9941]|uniref:Glycerol operon regulatory protein n=1 Tax=Rubrobacter xylanophilus (strain DSM 9941 / JCM 11954 / NBRC 16129 / PRD-1) TaxID=266117 RepID=Q1AS66_RUBXD|nr:IclR family transcriptional regulator [Rubrobacter xylanophilus]ABG05762.1 transcriptional regulator, IclR family [Rubrobacter xylanophilus DSM 9941]
MAGTAANRSSRGEVQSLARALDILELLGRSESELGVTEIGPAVGLPNGTAHRLLATLTRRGYARQVGESRKYTLGPKALVLASSAREHLGSLAQPYLEELMEISQESSNLATLDRNAVVYIEQVPAPRMVRMFTEPGNRVPPHATGTGKVLLAYHPEEVVESVIQQTGLVRFTAHTVTDPRRLRRELAAIREQGYAIDSEEMEEGVRCLAAPVFGPDGKILAAMSVSGPAGRLSEARLEELIPHIKRIADEFSRDLQGTA